MTAIAEEIKTFVVFGLQASRTDELHLDRILSAVTEAAGVGVRVAAWRRDDGMRYLVMAPAGIEEVFVDFSAVRRLEIQPRSLVWALNDMFEPGVEWRYDTLNGHHPRCDDAIAYITSWCRGMRRVEPHTPDREWRRRIDGMFEEMGLDFPEASDDAEVAATEDISLWLNGPVSADELLSRVYRNRGRPRLPHHLTWEYHGWLQHQGVSNRYRDAKRQHPAALTLSAVLEVAAERGCGVLFGSLTAPHVGSAEEIRSRFRLYLDSGNWPRRVKKILRPYGGGYLVAIKECTADECGDGHLHCHTIVITREAITDEQHASLCGSLDDEWRQNLRKVHGHLGLETRISRRAAVHKSYEGGTDVSYLFKTRSGHRGGRMVDDLKLVAASSSSTPSQKNRAVRGLDSIKRLTAGLHRISMPTELREVAAMFEHAEGRRCEAAKVAIADRHQEAARETSWVTAGIAEVIEMPWGEQAGADWKAVGRQASPSSGAFETAILAEQNGSRAVESREGVTQLDYRPLLEPRGPGRARERLAALPELAELASRRRTAVPAIGRAA